MEVVAPLNIKLLGALIGSGCRVVIDALVTAVLPNWKVGLGADGEPKVGRGVALVAGFDWLLKEKRLVEEVALAEELAKPKLKLGAADSVCCCGGCCGGCWLTGLRKLAGAA